MMSWEETTPTPVMIFGAVHAAAIITDEIFAMRQALASLSGTLAQMTHMAQGYKHCPFQLDSFLRPDIRT